MKYRVLRDMGYEGLTWIYHHVKQPDGKRDYVPKQFNTYEEAVAAAEEHGDAVHIVQMTEWNR